MNSPANITDPLVLFMPSGKRGRFPGRHAGARCRAPARRLCRERVRRTRHLRPLPDRGAGRQFRQAQDRLLQRPHLAQGPEGRALRARARPARGPPPVLLGHRSSAISSSTCRRTRSSTRRSCARLPPTASSSAMPPSSSAMSRSNEPDMHKPLGDLDRLKLVLEKDWGWKDLLVAPHLIPQVQGILRKGNWGVTAAIHRDMDSRGPSSSACGRASRTKPTASPATSARPPSPCIWCRCCRAASSPPPARRTRRSASAKT